MGPASSITSSTLDADTDRKGETNVASGNLLLERVTRLGYAFFSIATLSFLGLGIQPPSADWGLAVADGYGFLTGGKWWVVVFNSGAIVSLVMATNLIAQGIGAFENVDG
ncbi:hypothetical protein NKH09_24095 [Mesorhizobium sp. M1339]|uniref:hypothetical protein n=1 Tax=Mesorhizobium sp. M1339 TaxID=2957086 RepID=UPI00333514C5